jgi:hypothetical protein
VRFQRLLDFNTNFSFDLKRKECDGIKVESHLDKCKNLSMPEVINVSFKKRSRRDWVIGLFVSALFLLMLVASAALLPIKSRYFPVELSKFYYSHQLLYLLAFACFAILLFRLCGAMLFGWIPRALTSKPAAILDDTGIESWTTNGRQRIVWNDLSSFTLHRPIEGEERRFILISMEGVAHQKGNGFTPKIVMDSDTMDFNTRDILRFVQSKRPDLTSIR